MNRRSLIKRAAGTAGLLVASSSSAASLCLQPTKAQTEGPFYPLDWEQYEADADMTHMDGAPALAKGQLAIIKGTVTDYLSCQPIANAQVDVWQANAFGQYFHEKDANFNELKDQNFQYRSRIFTDAQGKFSVKTIKPAAYPAGGDWIRPPHVHYKVIATDYRELITQMYFDGEPLNEIDRILQSMSPTQKEGVTVDFTENQAKILTGEFKISLIPV